MFLVALPLCLGIALASGAPLMAGLIAGIVGGIVVSVLSDAQLAVSGPAAGLTVIVLEAVEGLGSFEAFLVAVILGGLIQIGFGFARAGVLGYYFPNTVIKGMLAAIGIILILKQIPHAIGYEGDAEGDMEFFQADGRNTFTEIPYALGHHFHLGALLIALLGLAILIIFEKVEPLKKLTWLPAALVVVVTGIVLNEILQAAVPALANHGDLLVQLPNLTSREGLQSEIRRPDWAILGNPALYRTAVTIAIVASLETLLCIEAIDKLDPFKRETDTNRELKAQGVGNIVAGLLGGLPMTAVIVRGSANIHSGGRTKASAFTHGVLLLVSVFTIPFLLNMIPLASLAAVLLFIGYKLAPVHLFQRMFKLGPDQYLPFLVTIVAILFTDLLIGVAIGLAVGFLFILLANFQNPHFLRRTEEHEEGQRHVFRLELAENVSFLNKAALNRTLQEIPEYSRVTLDGSKAVYIDRDVLELLHDFENVAEHRDIIATLQNIPEVEDGPFNQLAIAARAETTVTDAQG